MEKLWNSNYCKVMAANFSLFFAFYVLTPLLPLYLSEHFGATKDMIGLVLSGYTVTALVMRPFSGFLVDSFPRKTVLLLSFTVFAIFFAGYLAASTLLMFTIVRTLHGGPFGALTVANSTVAIDVLPSSRRTEGIGYYGLSNNLAMAIAPTIGIFIYRYTHSFELLFWIALIVAFAGLAVDASLKTRPRKTLPQPLKTLPQPLPVGRGGITSTIGNTATKDTPTVGKNATKDTPTVGKTANENTSSVGKCAYKVTIPLPTGRGRGRGFFVSLDRFFLLRGWLIGANMVAFGFSFGVLSNYLAIYGKEVLGISGGTGAYFMLCSLGLMLSRLQGGKALRQGRVTHNAASGMVISLVGYTLFILIPTLVQFAGAADGGSKFFTLHASLFTLSSYYLSALLIGLGNGHMWPAFQNMTISVAPNSQRGTANSTILVSWDVGMGMGILAGGIIAEHFGYGAAFWTVVAVNALGVLTFFATTRRFFLQRNLNPGVR